MNAVAFLNDTNPSVATFDNGNFIVVWNKLDASGVYNIYAQVWDSSVNRIGNIVHYFVCVKTIKQSLCCY